MLNKNVEMDLTDGPIMKKLLMFSVPLLLTGILQLLFTAADIIVVGRFAGEKALASVGATASLTNLVVNVFMMTSVGVSVVVANHYGANEYHDVGETVSTAVGLSLIMGMVVGTMGILLARTLLIAAATPADVLEDAILYMRIYFLSMPAFMVYNFGAAVLRAVGDTRYPLVYLSIAGVINVLLNLFMVIVLNMGVAGVAIATAVSQYISAGLVFLRLIHADSCIHLDLKALRINGKKLKGILKIGLPAGLQSLLYAISNVLIQSSINSFGSVVMAGNAAAQNIEGFICNPMSSVQQAATSFTGQCMGAKKYKNVNEVFWKCIILESMIAGIVCALGFFFREGLVSIYNSSPEVIRWGSVRLMIMCSTYYFLGLFDIMLGTMRGMGVSLVPTYINLIGICGMRVAWVFTVFAAHRSYEILLIR